MAKRFMSSAQLYALAAENFIIIGFNLSSLTLKSKIVLPAWNIFFFSLLLDKLYRNSDFYVFQMSIKNQIGLDRFNNHQVILNCC
jgi:hypothetical protein